MLVSSITGRARWYLVRLVVLVVVLVMGAPRQTLAQGRMGPDSIGVSRTARDFLVAFDSLRWEPFAAYWSSDATVFLPDADAPHLLVGRTAVLGYFRTLFDDVASAAKTPAATLGIMPSLHALRIQLVGSTTALVTFELGRGRNPGRRTTLWQWHPTERAWQLVHLHASTLAAQ